jgi:endoglucanase
MGALGLLIVVFGLAKPSPVRSVSYRLAASRTCAPAPMPRSPRARSAYLERLASERRSIAKSSKELARVEHLLVREERHSAGSSTAIEHAKLAAGRLKRALACLSAKVGEKLHNPATRAAAGPVGARPVAGNSDRVPEATAGTSTSRSAVDTPVGTEAPITTEAPTLGETPTIVGSAPALVPGKFSIAVSGAHLVNASGAIVALHGVDISRSQWACLYGHAFESPTNEASIAAMVSWHINAVRIPLNEDCWLGINGTPMGSTTYQEEIRNYVAALGAAGIYVILDLHWSAPGSTLSHLGAGFAGFYEMADESHSPAFWESVASYFESNHAVLFDLFNEPFGISWSCWLDGCVAPRGYQTAGMQQLVDAVRSTGATQPVMVGGLERSSELGQEWLAHRPVDPANQLVASIHVYSQTNVARFNDEIAPVAAQFPVVTGETGDTSCVDNDFDAYLPWADAHGVSYLAWAWTTGECAADMPLISNYSGTPTAYGLGYREHLRNTFPEPSP